MTFKIHPYLSYLVELASYLAKMKDNRENLAIVSKVLDFEFFKLDYIAIDIIQKKKVCFQTSVIRPFL